VTPDAVTRVPQLGLDWDAIFRDRVLPALGVASGGVASPSWTFVCGQPGSGKTRRITQLAAKLGPDQCQIISGDALCALVPELFRDPDDPALVDALSRYERQAQPAQIDALVTRAMGLRAHVLHEVHLPVGVAKRAATARAAGYQVICEVLALPPHESWLATLQRDVEAAATHSGFAKAVAWDRLLRAYHRWPAFFALAEAEVTFDTLRILGRDGEVLFENTATVTNGHRHWTGPVFAFESLLVERLQPRSLAQRQVLLAAWQALRAHPALAFQNRPAWPHASITALGDLLQSACTDPAFGFDLNQPPVPPDLKAATGWATRLRADLIATLSSVEAQGQTALPARGDGLLALVARLLAQPAA
jgi:Zeta toxin